MNNGIMKKLPLDKKIAKEIAKGGRKYFVNDQNKMWYQSQIGLNLIHTIWNDLLSGNWMEADFVKEWIDKLADIVWRFYHRNDEEAPIILTEEAALEAIEKIKADLTNSSEDDFARLKARMNIVLQLIDLLYMKIDKEGWNNEQIVLDFADELNKRSIKY